MRETVEECEMIGDDAILDGVKGQLMIDGVWRKVEETELLAIRSAIKIFPLPESSETPTDDATGGGRAVTKARKRKAFKERSDTPTGDAAGGGRAVANAPKKAAKKQKKKAQGDSDTPTVDATGGGADTPTGGATGGGSDTPTGDATGGGSDTPTGDATEGGKRKAYKEERKKKARMAQL